MDDYFDLRLGKSEEVLKGFPDNHFDSVVTDPPYHLTSIVKRFGKGNSAPAQFGTDGAYARASKGFMGKIWDGGDIAFQPQFWAKVIRVLKPGGHMIAFSGSRTYHRMACAIEDAGFEIRDQIMWLYGSGFPKSHDVSKGIDKAAGAIREVVGTKECGMGSGKTFGMLQAEGDNLSADRLIPITAPATAAAAAWQGWGTALKPAHEPMVLARKPLIGSVASNVLKHGTGAINTLGCAIGDLPISPTGQGKGTIASPVSEDYEGNEHIGRWPANICHDGSEEVVSLFNQGTEENPARFFYSPKASREDRDEGLENFPSLGGPTMGSGIGGQPDQEMENNKNTHPTVKPCDLMRYLCRLITPPNGLVLDVFMGSGSTGKAAMLEGFRFVGIDMTEEYIEIARARIQHAYNQKYDVEALIRNESKNTAQRSLFD